MSKVKYECKTRNVVNTYLNVTFEDRRSNAPTLAKIEFGKWKLPSAYLSSRGPLLRIPTHQVAHDLNALVAGVGDQRLEVDGHALRPAEVHGRCQSEALLPVVLSLGKALNVAHRSMRFDNRNSIHSTPGLVPPA